jgi:uncharacterized protein (DUF2249 family)
MSGFAGSRPAERLDLRGLDPPEPMRRALEAVEARSPGEAVEIVTDRDPMLLYRELDRRGHTYVRTSRPDGFYTLIRCRKEGEAP